MLSTPRMRVRPIPIMAYSIPVATPLKSWLMIRKDMAPFAGQRPARPSPMPPAGQPAASGRAVVSESRWKQRSELSDVLALVHFARLRRGARMDDVGEVERVQIGREHV